MDWTSLAVFVGLALAIGAALDFVVTSSKKEAYAAWIARRSQPGSSFGYNGSKVLDRIFGSGLMSRRALNRYALISLASITFSFAFAYATSAPEEIEENIRLFPEGASSLAIGILALCIGFAVVGDFISYSITRLFIRTVDQYRTPVVSLGLVVADIVVSLVLFFLVFSFARAISYLLVLTLGSVPALTSEKHFLPKVVQAELREVGIDAFDPALASARTFAGAVASANREPELSRAATVLQVREGAVNRYVSYRASVACFELDSGQDIFSAIADTSDLVAEVVTEVNASKVQKLDVESVKERTQARGMKAAFGSDECPVEILTIQRRMTASALLSLAGLGNTYLAALERTLFDAYSVTAFKLAPYVKFDPFESLGDFFASIQLMGINTFLGMTPPDEEAVAVFTLFPDVPEGAPERLNVPFSPMVASSLTSSIFFLIYLSLIGITVMRNSLMAGAAHVLPNFELSKGLFTSFALAISIGLAVLLATVQMIGFLWSLFF